MKFNNEAHKEGKGGSLKKEDRINSKFKTDTKDQLNVVETKKAKSKALAKYK